ncbi:MAG: 30S ribosomal protein S6 [Myxococcales bacterium]|nr:30S ribosomal protein S6 [Myxococcales bacterium]
MREYETTFIVQPEISDEGVQTVCDRLDAVLSRRNATRLMVDDLGRRRLAYEIQNFQKGRYLTLMYLDTGDAVPEIERTLRLEDSVLRFLTIQVNDLVADVEARKAEAADLERLRAEKAAERAARDAEEAARAEAEEAARAEAEEAARVEAEEAVPAEAEEGEQVAAFSEGESDEEGDDDEEAEAAEGDDEEDR